jgi:rRNA-processing protein FCF1
LLIYDPDIIFKDGTVDFVIPMAVIKELDGLKKSDNDTVAKAARQVSRTLDRIGEYADLGAGVRLSTGSSLKVMKDYKEINDLASEEDNKILGTALLMKEAYRDKTIVLCTMDVNMKNVARLHGIRVDIAPGMGEFSAPLRPSRQAIADPGAPVGLGGCVNALFSTKTARKYKICTYVGRTLLAIWMCGLIAAFFIPRRFITDLSMYDGFIMLAALAVYAYRTFGVCGWEPSEEAMEQNIINPCLNPGFRHMRGNVWHRRS